MGEGAAKPVTGFSVNGSELVPPERTFARAGLNIAEITGLEVRPDEDALICEDTSSGSYFVILRPSEAGGGDARQIGLPVAVVFQDGDHAERSAGVVRSFVDNPSPGAFLPQDDFSISGTEESDSADTAALRAIAGPEEADFQQGPFQDDIIIESGGGFYHAVVPANFQDFVPGEAVTIAYRPSGGTATTRFSGVVHSVKDTLPRAKYVLAAEPEFVVRDLLGNLLPPDSETARTLAEAMGEELNLEAGKSYGRNGIKRRFKHLTRRLFNRLRDMALAVSPEVAWAEAGKTFTVTVVITAPAENFDVRFKAGPGMDARWVKEHVAEEDMKSLHDAALAVVAAKAPLSEKGVKQATRALRRFSRRDEKWEFLKTDSAAVSGALVFNPLLVPKATGFNITVDGEKFASEDLPGSEPREAIPTRRSIAAGKEVFAEISEAFAERDQILAVAREGVIAPYLPEIARENDRWAFVATDALPITAVAAPRYLSLAPPFDGKGRRLAPDAVRIQNLFREDDGRITSASIERGLAELTEWYTRRGYVLVNERLTARISGETLDVAADVLRLERPVSFAADPEDGYAESREKNLKFIEREFFRLRPGEPFDANELKRAVSEIEGRFPYRAVPHVASDNVAKTARVTVELIPKELGPFLAPPVVSGGYSGSSGLFFAGSSQAATQSGTKMAGSASFYPQAQMAGAGVSLSTPRDEAGARNEVSLTGNYYLDYISGVGASYYRVDPLRTGRLSLITGGGVDWLTSVTDIEGADAFYFKPNVGLLFEGREVTAKLLAGPRISTGGAVYAGVEGSLIHRRGLVPSGLIYAESYAKAGALAGGVPEAAMYHNVPVALHGASFQTPLAIRLYAGTGASVMVALPWGIADIGLGVNAGVVGGVLASVGAGVRIRIKIIFPVTVLVGPALVNGIPTPITVSLGT